MSEQDKASAWLSVKAQVPNLNAKTLSFIPKRGSQAPFGVDFVRSEGQIQVSQQVERSFQVVSILLAETSWYEVRLEVDGGQIVTS